MMPVTLQPRKAAATAKRLGSDPRWSTSKAISRWKRSLVYAWNARTHSEEQVAQIAASIREFGFTNPILVDRENRIIARHSRLLAARKLEMASVPAIELAGMNEAQKRAYVIADNKAGLERRLGPGRAGTGVGRPRRVGLRSGVDRLRWR